MRRQSPLPNGKVDASYAKSKYAEFCGYEN